MDFMRKYHTDLLLEKQDRILKAKRICRINNLIERKNNIKKDYLENLNQSQSVLKKQSCLEDDKNTQHVSLELSKEQDYLEDEKKPEQSINTDKKIILRKGTILRKGMIL